MSTQEKPCLPIFFTWSDEYGCQLWDKAGMQKYAKAAEVATIERCAKIVDGYIGSEPIANDIRALLPKEEG